MKIDQERLKRFLAEIKKNSAQKDFEQFIEEIEEYTQKKRPFISEKT